MRWRNEISAEVAMVITLGPEIEVPLREAAERLGCPPELLAMSALRERFPRRVPIPEPRDDWERDILSLGVDCGVSLSNEAVSSEGIYE